MENSFYYVLLLLLLSHFSRVQLCATLEMAAHQAPLSLGFYRQEHWSGLLFLLHCMKVKSESEVAQLCPTLIDPTDCSLPGSSIHGIFQARVLEWGAIAFSVFLCESHIIPSLIYLVFGKICHFISNSKNFCMSLRSSLSPRCSILEFLAIILIIVALLTISQRI